MILAGIDIGTNTLRLLIADADSRTLRILHSARTITRLGELLDRTGLLTKAATQRSLHALAAFNRDIRRLQPAAVCTVGTSALRNAGNAKEFIDEVRTHTGLEIRIITGLEEARLTLLGVKRSLNAEPAMVVDIGGGSTEIVSSLRSCVSLPLGAVYLTERFISRDPPLPADLERLRQEIRTTLDRSGVVPAGRGDLIGTAGTITTLASMDQALIEYDPARITGYTLTRHGVMNLVLRLSSTPISERSGIPGLEPGREDIILAGAVVAEEIMMRFGYERMVVSDWGLREGILFDLYDRIIHNTR
jgi:exopolyphosphatase / guanosine-5'-triphosphate,3'-diphosphate pyrophosphatase